MALSKLFEIFFLVSELFYFNKRYEQNEGHNHQLYFFTKQLKLKARTAKILCIKLGPYFDASFLMNIFKEN